MSTAEALRRLQQAEDVRRAALNLLEDAVDARRG